MKSSPLQFLIGSLCLLQISGFGQTTADSSEIIPGNKVLGTRIELSTDINYGSTNLTNKFIEKLLFGGRINDEMKDEGIGNINKKARFGVELNYDIKYVNLTDTLFQKLPDYNYYVGFGSYSNVSAAYSKDLFSTAFYGNKQFENQTAELGNSSFISTKFEKITIGLISKDNKTSYGVSLIIGDRLNSLNFKKADMFTHTDGTKIDMDYEGTIQLSDNENPGTFMSFTGAGLGLDYSKELYNHRLTVTNFGFSIWSKNSRYSRTEKLYEFEGVEIDNLLQVTGEELRDNALELLPELEDKPIVSLLPTIFTINRVMNDSVEWQPTYRVRYKLLSNYLPYANAGVIYKINQYFWVRGAAAYGGYAGLRAELGVYANYKHFNTGVESLNVTGMFMENGNGNGLQLFFNATF